MNSTQSLANVNGDLYHQVIQGIRPLPTSLNSEAQFKIDNKTKPVGSLGRLEKLAVQAALIQNDLNPSIQRKSMMVFGADHGITAEGISAYPAEVTYQMVENFFHGGAAINVICNHYGIDVKVIDMGVKGEFNDHPILVKRKVAQGTKNFAVTSAMTESEAIQAIEAGMRLVMDEGQTQKIDVLGVGEIGIGNTTSAAAIISAITGLSPEKTAGRGTGLDDQGLNHKVDVLRKALALHNPDASNGLEVVTKVGGFELAGIVGAILAAAAGKTMVVLDGVISTAAGLIAYTIQPDIKDFLVSGHKSVEVAQKAALEHMGLEPVIDLDMRLGEGTGAAITMDLVETACAIMRDMASFEEAGVSTKNA